MTFSTTLLPTDKLVVVKLGGSTLGYGEDSLPSVARLWHSGAKIVLVHGGGKTVSEWMGKLGLVPEFVQGLRKTDKQSLDVILGVLAGKINTEIVAQLISLNVQAVGISGVSGSTIGANPISGLGQVGQITHCNEFILRLLLDNEIMPVVSPLALNLVSGSNTDRILNVNADTVAGYLARQLKAKILILQTDVLGVMDENKRVIHKMLTRQAKELLLSGVAFGGMIPKLQACIVALEAVNYAYIIDGRKSSNIIDCLQGKAVGTRIS